MSEPTIDETLATLERHNGNISAAARELGVARTTLRERLDRHEMQRLRQAEGGSTAPVDGVAAGMGIRGTSTLYRIDDGSGNAVLQWVKTHNVPMVSHVRDAVEEFFETYQGRAEPSPPPPAVADDLLRLYAISDFHLSMYAWKAEAGEDYDAEIAEAILSEAVSDLVGRAEPAHTAVVLALGDFFHADNSSNQTARSGHALDVDTRYSRIARLGVRMMVECVELAAQKHQRVIVRCIPGNHDDHSALWLAIALDAFFNDDPRIEVDCSPSLFWKLLWGKTLLGAAHGDKAAMKDAAGIMAAMWPEEWGQSAFRYFHFGHIHHKVATAAHERHAVNVESHQTIAAKDAWGAGQGFVATRAMVAITYHKELGERARDTYSVPFGSRNREWLEAKKSGSITT